MDSPRLVEFQDESVMVKSGISVVQYKHSKRNTFRGQSEVWEEGDAFAFE